MKFLSLVLSFCLTFNVMAASSTVSELEKSLDEYQYAMTVEWDQKDQAFFDKTTNDFFEKMSSLMNQGMTKETVMAVLEHKVKDKTLINAANVKLSMMGKVSPEELSQVVQDQAKNLYANGASWNGETVLWWSAGIILVAVIAYNVWWESTHECASYNTKYVCGSPSILNGSQCWYEEYCEFYDKK